MTAGNLAGAGTYALFSSISNISVSAAVRDVLTHGVPAADTSIVGGGTLPIGPARGPGQAMTFDPGEPFNFAPFVIVAAAILVISFLARVIQPSTPHSGVYAAKLARPLNGSPKRPPRAMTQVLMPGGKQQKRGSRRLVSIVSKYARIVFGLLS